MENAKVTNYQADVLAAHKANPGVREVACKLSTPELRTRRETVISSLKNQVIERIELKTGYAYGFLATDEILNELLEFITTESACCNFFSFKLAICRDKREAWLELTGETDVKDFIRTELGF